MRNVSYSFLDNAEALADAIVELIRVTHHTLLSHHCHKLTPAGVSCVGVLLESHISFHTWPEEGVITFDLFTCGGTPLLEAIPLIKKYFGVPRGKTDGRGISTSNEDSTKVVTKWVHQLRGFRTNEQRNSHSMDDKSDLASVVLTKLSYHSKNQVVSLETSHQRVDIWDMVEEGTEEHSIYDMMDGPFPVGDPRYKNNPQSITPDRILFLNGKYKSSNITERAFHEALVHPAMFAHQAPKKVAILGRGETAVLREVLKHKTVEAVLMIEKDESLIDVIEEHMPALCDCSKQEGAADICLNDARTELKYMDALEFFNEIQDNNVQKFDVIVVNDIELKDNSKELIDSMIGSLTEDGIIVMYIGFTALKKNPMGYNGTKNLQEDVLDLFAARLETVFVYEESRGSGVLESTVSPFALGCVSNSCRNRWYARNDYVDYEVADRIVSSTDKTPILVHFDGGTQHMYKFPSRAWEDLYCRRNPQPVECQFRSLNLDKEIISWEKGFEMRTDQNGNSGIYATKNIEEGSYLMAEEACGSLFLSRDTFGSLVESTLSEQETRKADIKNLIDFTNKHGRESLTEGPGSQIVEVGPIIHVKKTDLAVNANAARISTLLPPLPSYSPVFERNRRMFDVLIVATHHIRSGEEIILHED